MSNLLIIIMVITAVMAFEIVLDFFPFMHGFFNEHESIYLDEIAAILIGLVVAGGIVYLRKWTALKKELRKRLAVEKELKDSEARLDEAQRIAKVGSWDWDVQADEFRMSEEAARTFGVRADQFGGDYDAFLDTIHPDEVEDVQNALFEAMFNGKVYEIERRVVRPDGTERYVRALGEVTFDGAGVPLRLAGTILDITDKKENERRLRDQIRKNEVILDSAGEGIIGINGDGKVIFANPAATRMLGYSQQELRQISLHDTWQRFYPDRRPYPTRKSPIRWAYRRGVASNVNNEVFWRKNGSSFFVHYNATPAGINGGYRGAVVVFNDVTEQKRNEELLQALSMEDDLTGLYNRRGFLAVAGQELKTARRNQWGIVMVYADLDGMKWINDNLGHEEGDAALIEAATVLKAIFRDADIIGRVGGDEFAVLATETGGEAAPADSTQVLKERLRRITAGHNAAEGRKYWLSLSIGVKRCGPGCRHTVSTLMKEADKLMYEDKRQRGLAR